MAMRPLVRVLFLGAGKRVSLLQRFYAAAVRENVDLEAWSIESSTTVPISQYAHVLPIKRRFQAPGFKDTLLDTCKDNGISIVIPNMDSATVALANASSALREMGITPVVSSYERCATMEDKRDASHWFKAIGAPTPESLPLTGAANLQYPRIFKARKGFGARDQYIINSPEERQKFVANALSVDYFEQPFVAGTEYSVDAYVDKGGNLLQAMTRERMSVVGGEVDTSKSVRHEAILKYTRMILSHDGWYGPITLQFIDPAPHTVFTHMGPQLIEINPRFGGGVIHSIELGLDMPRWIIQEHLGRPVGPIPQWREGSVMTRYRAEVFL